MVNYLGKFEKNLKSAWKRICNFNTIFNNNFKIVFFHAWKGVESIFTQTFLVNNYE